MAVAVSAGQVGVDTLVVYPCRIAKIHGAEVPLKPLPRRLLFGRGDRTPAPLHAAGSAEALLQGRGGQLRGRLRDRLRKPLQGGVGLIAQFDP